MNNNQTSFNPNEHMRQIKGQNGQPQDYLDVKWRLVWFRSECPDGIIETEELAYDLDREVEAEGYAWNEEKRRSEKITKRAHGYARYRAVAKNGTGGIGTGTKSENAASFADFGEKAETGAIGRALAALGYGTQFAPELDEEHRIVDSPVEREKQPMSNGQSTDQGAASKTQMASIEKLCQLLGNERPTEELSFDQAKALIGALSKEYNGQKANAKSR